MWGLGGKAGQAGKNWESARPVSVWTEPDESAVPLSGPAGIRRFKAFVLVLVCANG